MKIMIFIAIVITSSLIFFILKCLIEWLMYNEQLDARKVCFLNFVYGRLEDYLFDIKKLIKWGAIRCK